MRGDPADGVANARGPAPLVPSALLLPMVTVGMLLVLVLPTGAKATHDGGPYWFYTGWAPRYSDGERSFYHPGGGSPCCSWVVVRQSWSPSTHDMRFIWLTYNGPWYGYWAQSSSHQNQWDITQVMHASEPSAQGGTRSGGCQNHISWAWWRVWVNCHVRNFL